MKPRCAHLAAASRAFTLIELLVSMGIMGILASASIAGYYGATRSLAVRGARETVSSAIRMAKQRASSTQTRTAVFFRNELLKSGTQYDNEVVRGVISVVRMAGRVSAVRGKYLVDEYYDLNQSFQTTKNPSNPGNGFRLYRLPRNPLDAPKGSDFSVVGERVFEVSVEHADETLVTQSALEEKEGNDAITRVIPGYAFVIGGGYLSGGWAPGDPYAVEVSVIELPAGFIFGTDKPTSGSRVKNEPVKPIVFGPDGKTEQETSIKISLCQNTGGGNGTVTPTRHWMTDEVKDED